MGKKNDEKFSFRKAHYDKSIAATPPNNSRNSSLPRFREIPGKAGSNKNRDQGIWSEWGKLKTGAYDPPPLPFDSFHPILAMIIIIIRGEGGERKDAREKRKPALPEFPKSI